MGEENRQGGGYTGGPYATSYGSISGICASATAKACIDREKVSNIAFPCTGSRRWGGWGDHEPALGVNTEQGELYPCCYESQH